MSRQFDRKLRLYCAVGSATATMIAGASKSQGQVYQGAFSHDAGGGDSSSIPLRDASGQSFFDTGDDAQANQGTDGNSHSGAHLYLSNKFENYKGNYLYTGTQFSGAVPNLPLGTVLGTGTLPTGTTGYESLEGDSGQPATTDNDLAFTDSSTGTTYTPQSRSASAPTQFSVLTTGYFGFNIQPNGGSQTDYGYAAITFDANGNVSGTYAYDTTGNSITVSTFAVSNWNAPSGGDITNASNWIGGAPGGVNYEADFNNFSANGGSVAVNSSVVLGTVRLFSQNVQYDLTGTGSLNLNSSTGSALIVNEQGSHTIEVPVTFASAGSINVFAGSKYSGNNLTFNAPVTFNGAGTVSVAQQTNANYNNTLTINAPVTFNGSGTVNVFQAVNGSTNAIAINGPLTFNGGGSIHAGIYSTLNVTGTTTVAAGQTLSVTSDNYFNETAAFMSFAAFNVGNGANVSFNYNYPAGAGVISMSSLNAGAGSSITLTALNNGNGSQGKMLVEMGSVSLAPTSKIDLQANDLLIQGNTSLSLITNAIKSGYHNGAWNGTSGITSSTAAADTTHLTAIGVIENSTDGSSSIYGGSIGTFDNVNPGPTDILVRYTYYGDSNLDGQVDSADYTLIDNGFLTHLTGWYNGDFNYDNVVNGSDYTLIDNAFNMQGVNLVSSPGGPTAEIAAQIAGTSAVPEPSSLSLLAMGAVGLLRRKRA